MLALPRESVSYPASLKDWVSAPESMSMKFWAWAAASSFSKSKAAWASGQRAGSDTEPLLGCGELELNFEFGGEEDSKKGISGGGREVLMTDDVATEMAESLSRLVIEKGVVQCGLVLRSRSGL